MSYIKKGDTAVIRAGKDKGKSGKVLKIFPSKNNAIVEGVNLIKKHRRRRRQEEPAGILNTESPIDLSNIALYCSRCKKGVRVKINKGQDNKKGKGRICSKCQAVL